MPAVRPALAADLPVLAALDRSCSPVLRSEARMEALLAAGGELLLATAPGEPRGFAALSFAADEATLLNIVVAPAARRSGVGSGLLRAAVERAASRGCRRLFLECRRSNAAALNLYRRAGFSVDGVRRNYYPCSDERPAEDALLLSLCLEVSPEGSRN
jgi:ribosomal-protein-alanine N-acetyltransferase